MRAAFLYESIYLGMPAMYHAIGHDGANTEGFHAIELTSSRDLRTWSRVGNRSWFNQPSPLGPGGSGAYDLQQMIGASDVIKKGGELLMYYTCLKYRAPAQRPLG